MGFPLVSFCGKLLPMGATVIEGLRIAAKAAWKAWCRARPIKVIGVTGIANPSMARIDPGTGDPEDALPQDKDQLCLYRDQFGGFFTDTQIRLGLKLPQGSCVYAQACNDEVAEQLVDEMEAMLMDGITLTPAEQTLLKLLKQQLYERDVK